MAHMTRALNALLPRGVFAGKDAKALIEGLGVTLERLRISIRGIVAESNPGTASETAVEWNEMLALPDGIGSAARRSAFASVGGQSLEYLQGRLQDEFPNLIVTVTGNLTYTVSGNVNTSRERLRAESIVERLFPLYCTVSYNITTLAGTAVARCALGITGTARTGKLE